MVFVHVNSEEVGLLWSGIPSDSGISFLELMLGMDNEIGSAQNVLVSYWLTLVQQVEIFDDQSSIRSMD